ncbi:MAG: ribonuclease H-like domain-containing protein [Candidatus Marinimicrobia bacterium]|nr:ribonuclease H-like domain-containing protein [Candidatus Neomarinimicrobiota bacterium]MDP6852713.1 ribonuclease H-like domain-containing protein [Candidatus Neomarinimicrobiota bacterium]MDP6935875.1 ribonuclease H-like domain-containing protein [Candidatus Neomarinimicrobiota bacterium]
MAYLILDIETIPRPPLDEEVEEVISKKVQAHIDRTGDDPENAESLIRSTSPFFGKLLCVGLRWLQEDGSSRDKVICDANEEATLQSFFDIINHSGTKGVRFVHYNGLGFDIPFLIIRAAHHGINIQNYNFKDLRRFSYKSHIDLMMFLCNWNNYNAISMDVACRSFGIPSPKEGEVKGETVARAFEEGNIDAVNDYVMRDVEATHQLFEKLRKYIS